MERISSSSSQRSTKTSSHPSKLVLVTGGNGFLAMHIIQQLAREGHRVRTSIRNLEDKHKIEAIKHVAHDSKHPIQFVAADLSKPETWKEAVAGCDIVMHVATPMIGNTTDENLIIKPAVEGTLMVLVAAHEANVSRVVVTSSVATMYQLGLKNKTVNETDWCAPENAFSTYQKSKILAEKSAWDFVEEKKKAGIKCFELVVINPTWIVGPTLHAADSMSGSEKQIAELMMGKPEKLNTFPRAICDVRNLAEAHIKAAFLPEAAGHRHIVTSVIESDKGKFVRMKFVADILHQEFASKGFKIPLEEEPGASDPNVFLDNSRMIKVLGVKPIDPKQTMIDMANSLINIGAVKKA